MDQSKAQGEDVPMSCDAPYYGAIVSPDTRREQRLPPQQSRTKKWPILDASGPPGIDLAHWKLQAGGIVASHIEWDWKLFLELPRTPVFGDFHCVTRWSRLGNTREGMSRRELVNCDCWRRAKPGEWRPGPADSAAPERLEKREVGYRFPIPERGPGRVPGANGYDRQSDPWKEQRYGW